jgi:Ca2+-binding EF-hand superfamily protein
MKNRMMVTLVLVLGLGACASAGSFGRADADDDGRISRDEAVRSESLIAVFDYADANRDGYLSNGEFDSAQDVLRAGNNAHEEGPGAGGGGHSADGHQH